MVIKLLSLLRSIFITPGGRVSRFFSRKPVASYSTCENQHTVNYSFYFLSCEQAFIIWTRFAWALALIISARPLADLSPTCVVQDLILSRAFSQAKKRSWQSANNESQHVDYPLLFTEFPWLLRVIFNFLCFAREWKGGKKKDLVGRYSYLAPMSKKYQVWLSYT